MNPTVTSAADLIEERIRTEAPFYGMETASDLLQRLDPRSVKHPKFLRFPPTKEMQIIDEDTGAKWEPLRLDDDDDWFLGRLTVPEEHLSVYFSDILIDETHAACVPDMFVRGKLVISARAKALISEFAPEMCYFSPTKIIGKASGEKIDGSYFNVMVRTCLFYQGSRPKRMITPQGARLNVARPATWTSFCMNPTVQEAATTFPIFLFDREDSYPILSAGLLKHLKAAQISGLLEGTERIETIPKRPASYCGFETIFPLDPAYRN